MHLYYLVTAHGPVYLLGPLFPLRRLSCKLRVHALLRPAQYPGRSLPRQAGGKNCSGCCWSHAERSGVGEITGTGKSWAAHTHTTQADFVVIPAEGDAVRSGVHGCQEVIVSTRSSSPFKKGMEKLAMGSFFAPLRKIESVSATSLASFLRLPKFQVVSEGMSCLWGGKPPQKLAVPCCNVRFVQDRDVRRSQRRSLLAVLGFSELRANQWLRADFVT